MTFGFFFIFFFLKQSFYFLKKKLKILIWKAQGVPQSNNVAHPKHPEEEETSPNKTT